MADYIKREDAINALWKALYEFEDRMEETVTKDPYLDIDDWLISRIHVQSCHADCIDAVNAIPSADVAPIKRGEWLWDGYVYDEPYVCNCCGARMDYESNFCSHCGARMEEWMVSDGSR